jgi:signal transduction histidine kinase
VIDTACARAARIVGDLLIFARRQRPERRRVDLNELIRSALNLHGSQLELNKIRLVTNLEPTPAIWADAHQLQQVFLNLFSNAIHAMKTSHGHGTLTVRSAHRDSDVMVDVEDDGPGIAPEHLGRIFDPFFTTKPVGEGTGLGLSLSHGIIERHGGTIQVESEPGKGATFVIDLPLVPVGDAKAAVG